MRAVDHAVGSLCSRRAQEFTDTTFRGLQTLSQSLRVNRENPHELDARHDRQIGVWLSSTAMMRGQYGASHGLSWHLSAVADIAQGHTLCVLLPSVLRDNAPSNRTRQRQVSVAMGRGDVEAADAVLELIKYRGMPYRLRDVGIDRSHFDKIATDTLHNPLVRNNARPIDSKTDVLEILEMAW